MPDQSPTNGDENLIGYTPNLREPDRRECVPIAGIVALDSLYIQGPYPGSAVWSAQLSIGASGTFLLLLNPDFCLTTRVVIGKKTPGVRRWEEQHQCQSDQTAPRLQPEEGWLRSHLGDYPNSIPSTTERTKKLRWSGSLSVNPSGSSTWIAFRSAGARGCGEYDKERDCVVPTQWQVT